MPHLGHTELMLAVVTAGVHMWALVKRQKLKHVSTHSLVCERIYLNGVSLGLTFAGIDALKPPVFSVSVADTSTILIPSTATSATTDSA